MSDVKIKNTDHDAGVWLVQCGGDRLKGNAGQLADYLGSYMHKMQSLLDAYCDLESRLATAEKVMHALCKYRMSLEGGMSLEVTQDMYDELCNVYEEYLQQAKEK